MTVSRAIQLQHYIESGTPALSDFNVITTNIPAVGQNEILVKNQWMSVDPYMRGRMVNRSSYIPAFELNAPLQGQAIGVVESSQHKSFVPGDVVSSFNGWREYFIAKPGELEKLETDEKYLPYYLGALGMPGLTAYAGLLKIGKPHTGETVFVSAATGAVGAIVCQIAKLRGCKVIASAGSAEKIKWLREEINVDVAFNYKDSNDITTLLEKLVPNGIDVYFDTVGGQQLEAAISNMNAHGRIVMCGVISQYNRETPVSGPSNLIQIIGKRLTLQGFIVSDFESVKAEFHKDMLHWLQAGKIKIRQSIVEGVENAPQAFINLFSGKNFGKQLVKLC